MRSLSKLKQRRHLSANPSGVYVSLHITNLCFNSSWSTVVREGTGLKGTYTTMIWVEDLNK